jgi:hypothetical protein
MNNSEEFIDLLRLVLENLSKPENLSSHPWVKSHMIEEACRLTPDLRQRSAGTQLIQTISSLFRKMMPNMPPKRGLRLDNHWGEFGILAAQYFAPLLYNFPFPVSLREAWQSIDRAIILFVFDKKNDITTEDLKLYQLIGNEPDIAPNSTISDWHRKGLEQFAEIIAQYELHLKSRGVIEGKKPVEQSKFNHFITEIKSLSYLSIWFGRIAAIFVLGLVLIGVWKGWGFYRNVKSVKIQVEEILEIYHSSPTLDKVQDVSQRVSKLRNDMEILKSDINPILKISPYLGWVPVYGGDLKQATYLTEMAVQMSIAGDEVLKAVVPLVSSFKSNQPQNILGLLSELKDVDTQLFAAQIALVNVQSDRQNIQPELLSPLLKNIIIEKVDPLLLSINSAFPVSDVLQMARLAPRLLGAIGNGQQTYMILVQNEDELRPTGGFLTAVGLLEIEDGKLINLSFESSEFVDDLTKSYPKAPRQLNDYMMSEILLFRDANWFTNFPTTVEWTKFLYSYTNTKPIDGVIAIDQYVVKELLQIVGPIEVSGASELITSENVMSYMRSAIENKPPPGVLSEGWDRKQFISRLSAPLINKLLSGESQTWPSLITLIIQLLDEKHILLQFNDPEMSTLISQQSWDGSVRPLPNSDFLMVVDSNIGFNKTNVLTQTTIDYTFNLTNPTLPTGILKITHTNNSSASPEINTECVQMGGQIRELQLSLREYIIIDCYWSYLRIYSPADSLLISSNPQEIPQNWSLRKNLIPAKTDILKENIFGTQTFGTLVVVPIGQTLQTKYTYQLPAMVVSKEPDGISYKYTLKVQKQPGTLAIPLDLHLVLPPGMTIPLPPPGFELIQGEWVSKSLLKDDLIITLVFTPIG